MYERLYVWDCNGILHYSSQMLDKWSLGEWLESVHKDDRILIEYKFKECLIKMDNSAVIYRNAKDEQKYQWTVFIPVININGNTEYYVFLTRELSVDTGINYVQFVNNMEGVAVFSLDENGVILSNNRSFMSILGEADRKLPSIINEYLEDFTSHQNGMDVVCNLESGIRTYHLHIKLISKKRPQRGYIGIAIWRCGDAEV